MLPRFSEGKLSKEKEETLNQLFGAIEKNFLRLFFDNLMNKTLINDSILARESAYMNPSKIFITDHGTLAQQENIQDGYYFIQDDAHFLLTHVKNGVSKALKYPEENNLNEIILSILAKKPPNKNLPLSPFKIQDEFTQLTKIIQSISGHQEALFTRKYLTINDCEKKGIFTKDGTIDRDACSHHSVTIDEKRINIVILHGLDPSIQLSHRENLILEAAISNTLDQLQNLITMTKCYQLFSELSDAEKSLIDELYVTHGKKLANKILSPCKNIKLKGAPFYEPTEAFKMDIYISMFTADIIQPLEEKMNQDADKIFYSLKNKKENIDIGNAALCKLTLDALYKIYSPFLATFDNAFDKPKYTDMERLLLESVSKYQKNNTIKNIRIPPPKSGALRLIVTSGEGLVKMLNPIFIKFSEILPRNDIEKWKANLATVDQKWEFTFEQLLNPRAHRPERQALPKPLDGFSFSPLLQTQVNPALLEVQSLDHTVMTSTTRLPKDGKMRLFGASHCHAIGLVFDIRMCDLVGEHFVFDTDTYTVNDWWHNPNATRYHNEFKGRTINQLTIDQQLDEKVDYIRDYNEILSGVNAAGISSILFQPAVDIFHSDKKDIHYYEERLNLIYRKLYVASLLGRHLPIIIFDARNGTTQYTIEDQLTDLQEINQQYQNNSILNALLDSFNDLCKSIPEEFESKKKPDIVSDDINKLQKKKNIRINIFKLQNDINHLYQKLFILSNKQALIATEQRKDGLFNQVNDSFKTNKTLIDGLMSEKLKQIKTLLHYFHNHATQEEYTELYDHIENQHLLSHTHYENNSPVFQKIIVSVLNRQFNDIDMYKHSFSFLKKLANNPEYDNENLEIEFLLKTQKETIKNKILSEIKEHYPQFDNQTATTTISFSLLSSLMPFNNSNENRQKKLISDAVNEFEKNIEFYSGIYNLKQLVIAHVKQKAIKILTDTISDLRTDKVIVNQFGAYVIPNKKAECDALRYELLINQLKSFDINVPLHTFFNKNKTMFKFNYDDPVILSLIELARFSIFIPKQEDSYPISCQLSESKQFTQKM